MLSLGTRTAAPLTQGEHASVVRVCDLCSLVVFGGFNGTAILSDMFVFSLHTYAWNRLNLHGPLPLPGVYGHTMSAVPNSNAVVVFGGCLSAAKLSARTYWVDLQSGTAVQVLVQEPPPSRFWHGECVSSTKLYIFGGSGSKSNALTDVAMLDFFETTPVVPSKISSRTSTPLRLTLEPVVLATAWAHRPVCCCCCCYTPLPPSQAR